MQCQEQCGEVKFLDLLSAYVFEHGRKFGRIELPIPVPVRRRHQSVCFRFPDHARQLVAVDGPIVILIVHVLTA